MTEAVARRSCGAVKRGSLKRRGWYCSGRNLVKVMTAPHPDRPGDHLPVVVPRRLLQWAKRRDSVRDFVVPEAFAGGDHVHMVVRASPRERLRSWWDYWR